MATETKKPVARHRPTSSLPTTTLAQSGLSAMGQGLENLSPEERKKRIKRLFLLLYGPPKIGKSITAHALPNTRTLDFDNGMQSIEWAVKSGKLNRRLEDIVYKTILPDPNPKKGQNVLDEASMTIDEWIADEDIPSEEWDKPYPQFWDTLIIDSASPLTDSTIIKGLQENARLSLSKSWERYTGQVIPMTSQDWGSAASLFMKFINVCRGLGKNVVVICHEYTNTDDEGKIISIEPLVIGQLRQKLPGMFDEVWYAMVKGTRQDPKYLFQTVPDPLRRLGSRLGCLEYEEKADFEAIKDKVAKFYGVPKDMLWTAAHGSEGMKQAQKEDANEPLAGI